MCGGKTCTDMAIFGCAKERLLRSFMKLGHGIPSHDAFSDLFNQLDPDGMERAMLRAARDWAASLGDVVAVDGKSPGARSRARRNARRCTWCRRSPSRRG